VRSERTGQVLEVEDEVGFYHITGTNFWSRGLVSHVTVQTIDATKINYRV
jgi:hypothetical protein